MIGIIDLVISVLFLIVSVAILLAVLKMPSVKPAATKPVSPVLIVMVFDLGDQTSISIGGCADGQDIDMRHVAYAAAYMSGLAAKHCEDGMEKGLEHIQADAIRMHLG